MLQPGQAAHQMREACEELKALHAAYEIMPDDNHVAVALDIAKAKFQRAAYEYVQAHSSTQQSAPQVRPTHRAPGNQQEQRPYSRTDVRPPNSGVSHGVALPIPPLNTPPQAPTMHVARVPAAGNISTAPGMPDAVVPPGAQLHPKTLARMQAAAASSTDQDATQGAVDLPAPPPMPGGDLPDVPLMPPPGAPPTR